MDKKIFVVGSGKQLAEIYDTTAEQTPRYSVAMSSEAFYKMIEEKRSPFAMYTDEQRAFLNDLQEILTKEGAKHGYAFQAPIVAGYGYLTTYIRPSQNLLKDIITHRTLQCFEALADKCDVSLVVHGPYPGDGSRDDYPMNILFLLKQAIEITLYLKPKTASFQNLMIVDSVPDTYHEHMVSTGGWKHGLVVFLDKTIANKYPAGLIDTYMFPHDRIANLNHAEARKLNRPFGGLDVTDGSWHDEMPAQQETGHDRVVGFNEGHLAMDHDHRKKVGRAGRKLKKWER